MKVSTQDKTKIYKELTHLSVFEVGKKLGYDKDKTKDQLRNFIYSIKREVEKEPAKFGIGSEVVALVATRSKERQITGARSVTLKDVENLDLSKMMTTITKKALYHLDKKLSKANLKDVSITALATTLGISIDKYLLLTGQATENIAFRAKIDINVTNDQLLAQLLKKKETDETKR